MSTVDGIEGGDIGTETQPEIMLGNEDGLPLHHESLLPGQDSSSPQTHRQSVGNYVKSANFIELIICLGVFAVGLLVSEFVFDPRTRSALLQNTQEGDIIYDFRFGEAYVDETIPTTELVLIAVVAPLIIQFVLAWFMGSVITKYNEAGDAHRTICAYAVGLALTGFTTNFVKTYVGYLRPHYYERCEVDLDTMECSDDTNEIRKSFPSGHASMSFCGMTLVSLYLLRKFGSSTPIFVNQESGIIHYTPSHPLPRARRLLSIICSLD
eukprot:scaffold2658_cov53-Attheya_sp.AAC.2